jgi:hypothetical protein
MDGLFVSTWDALIAAKRRNASSGVNCASCWGGCGGYEQGLHDVAGPLGVVGGVYGGAAAATVESAVCRPPPSHPAAAQTHPLILASTVTNSGGGRQRPCVWSLERALQSVDFGQGVPCAPCVSFAAAAKAWPMARRNVIRTYALPHAPDGTPLLTYKQLRDHEPWEVGPSYESAPYWP